MAEKRSTTKPKKAAAKKPSKKPAAKAAEKAKAEPKKAEKPAAVKAKAEAKAEAKPKRVEAKPAEKKPETKPAEKKPETKPEAKPEQKKSKMGWIIALIVVAALAIIGAVVAVLCLNKTDPADPTAKLGYSKSFFIYDKGKYTLWNAEGKRVTEDEYSNQSNFVGGYAMVKKDDKYAIIREDGSVAVDFGKYGNITNKSGLYLAQDGNTKEDSLITGSGKELAKGNNLKVYTPNAFSGFAAVEVDGKMKVFNYTGELVKEFDVAKNADEPILSGLNDFGLVNYDEQNIVLDARTGKLLAEFDGPRHTFENVSDSRKLILIENYKDDDKYKLVTVDGKIYNLEETKNYGMSALDTVVGYDNYSEVAILDENYKVAKKVSTYVALKDVNNYATEDDDGDAVIYYNGEIAKNFGDDSTLAASGVMYDDLYAIGVDGKYKFYNLDGSVAIDHEFEDIYTLFDEFHHAIVSDKDGEYYLIDTKGNKIGDEVYKTILIRKGGYELKNEDGKWAIANQNGEPVTEAKYDSVYYRNNAEPHNIWTGRTGYDEFDVIDVENGKVLLEGVDVDGFYTNYFTVKKDSGDTKYYTYDGTLFYTAEK